MTKYAYRGNPKLIDAIEARLSEAGFSREGEVEIAQVVLTYFTNMTELEDVYFGDGGLAQTMTPGSLAIDLSAATPNLAMEISSVCAVSDIGFASAPLVVKNKVEESAFERSNMACHVGGDGDAAKDALPFLQAIFGDVAEVPDAGSAQLARAAYTVQDTAKTVAAVEVVSLFKGCTKSVSPIDVKGLVPEATSPEAHFVMRAIRDNQYKSNYTVEMLLGEISAAMMTADDYEMILPQTEAAFHLYELLAVIGGSDMSPAALSLVYEGNHEETEGASAYGLDWHRAEHLYGDNASDDALDEFDADELDFSDDDDEFGAGFGYSVN